VAVVARVLLVQQDQAQQAVQVVQVLMSARLLAAAHCLRLVAVAVQVR
jgi:hypothetical protein